MRNHSVSYHMYGRPLFSGKRAGKALAAAFAAASLIIAGAGNVPAEEKETAVTINGQEYSLAEYNYYFFSWYGSFTQQNEAYLPYLFDEGKSLKEQEYEEGKTWYDFFVDESLLSMQQIVTLSSAAEEEGYVLSPAAWQQIHDTEEAASSFAGTLGMDTDAYLAYFYGEGMDSALFEKCLKDAQMADGYADAVLNRIPVSEEEVKTYYREHIRDYTTVRYERFFSRASAMGTEPGKEEKTAAEETAREIMRMVEKGTPLSEASEPFSDAGKYVSFDDASYLNGSVYGDWLFDADRRDGDIGFFEEMNGYYVMVFHERKEADYPTADVLDAFFPLHENGSSAEEQMEASCLQAEAFYEQWQEEGGTEESFAEKAALQAEISGTPVSYPSVYKGTFENNIDRFLFSPDRAEGDCQVLYSSAGFHVMYYKGTGIPAWCAQVTHDLKEQGFQEWFDELMADSGIIRNDKVLERAGGY